MEAFSEDLKRAERFTIEDAGIVFDHSKNRLTCKTIGLLVREAGSCGLRERIEAMFRGEKINVAEQRAELHEALRAAAGESGVSIPSTDGVWNLARCWQRGSFRKSSAPGKPNSNITVPPMSIFAGPEN